MPGGSCSGCARKNGYGWPRCEAADSAAISAQVALRRGLPLAGHALGDHARLESRDVRQRALHQQPRHADAERAGDQLVHHQPAVGVEARATAPAAVSRTVGSSAPRSGSRRSSHPFGERRRRRVPPPSRQHVRDGLGEVADGVVALVEQPVGDRRRLDRQPREQSHRHDLARLVAGEEVHRPGRVARRRARKYRSIASTLVRVDVVASSSA